MTTDALTIIREGSIKHGTTTWARAMTAHFGPVGIHLDWTDADGRPTPEALAKFPNIGHEMAKAQRWLEGRVPEAAR